MRKLLLLLPLLVAGLALPGATAGGQEGEGPRLFVTKVVDGPGPTGGYVVTVTCTVGGPHVLAFDFAGPGSPETRTVLVGTVGNTCTVQETDANGADETTYQCEATNPIEGPAVDDFTCLDDQTVAVVAEPSGSAEVTVTNRFDPPLPSDDVKPGGAGDNVHPQPVVPAVVGTVVSASPGFTG